MMKKLIIAFSCLAATCSCAFAQTGSSKSSAALNAEVFTFFPDQNSSQIIPFNTRQMLLDIIASSLAGGALNLSQSATGSVSGGLTVPSADNPVGVYQLLVPSDNVTRPSSGTNKYANLLLQHAYGGSALVGGRDSLDVESYLTATTSVSNNDRNYQAANFEWYANVNETGTGGSPAGAGFAIGGAAILAGGATNWLNLSFMEVNVAVTTGASVAYKSGIQIASLPQDATQGSVTDCMICYSALSGAVGWKNAMLLTAANGQQPLASSGCVLCSTGSATITTGIDLSSYTISGNFLHSANFTITGAGALNMAGHLSVTPAAAPTIGTCATGTVAAGSSDVGGRVTMGSGQTSCSINFATTYAVAPFCTITGNANATALVGTSTTQLTGTFSAAVTLMNWVCIGA